ncbi:MAG: sulfatase-like hydrolase/transferase, partial [Myxococcota bacterium]|nr:sulfatase-like hydrolase/transferase [Myxococcota bacterium]
RHKDEPFFLYLPYTIPHANNEAGRKLGDGMEVPDYGPFASEDWPNPEKGRAAMIWKLDRDFGTIMSALDRLEIADDTLVIFTSDNGPHSEGGSKSTYFNSSGPLRGMKRSLHDGGIRVPAIARWPGKIAPGTESDLPWTFWDVLPTLAELAGVSPPEKVDGVSILPTLRGEKQA